VENFVSAYAFAAIPARFALERGAWKEAATLKLSPGELAWNKFRRPRPSWFSSGLGAARIGDAGRRGRRGAPAALKDAMTAAKNRYWPPRRDFQIKAVNALDCPG